MIKNINSKELKALIGDFNAEDWKLNNEKPVLIDFYADWCGPCKHMSPVLERIAADRVDIEFVKLNIEEDSEAVEVFGIQSIPTLLLFKKDRAMTSLVGYSTKEEVLLFLDEEPSEKVIDVLYD